MFKTENGLDVPVMYDRTENDSVWTFGNAKEEYAGYDYRQDCHIYNEHLHAIVAKEIVSVVYDEDTQIDDDGFIIPEASLYSLEIHTRDGNKFLEFYPNAEEMKKSYAKLQNMIIKANERSTEK